VLAAVPLLSWLQAAENELTGEGLAGLHGLEALVTLNAGRNKIKAIPPGTFTRCKSLKALVLNDNEISATDFLKKLKGLTVLVLSRNQLGPQLNPRHFAGLRSLMKINLAGNAIEELPDLSPCAETLVELRAANNALRGVPQTLRRCKKLKVVELGSNRISSWRALAPLTSLERITHLSLKGNPICTWAAEAPEAPAAAPEDGSGEEPDTEEEESEDDKANKPATNYVDKVRELFPKLVVMDGQRVMLKRTHGFKKPEGENAGAEDGGSRRGGSRHRERQPREEGGERRGKPEGAKGRRGKPEGGFKDRRGKPEGGFKDRRGKPERQGRGFGKDRRGKRERHGKGDKRGKHASREGAVEAKRELKEKRRRGDDFFVETSVRQEVPDTPRSEGATDRPRKAKKDRSGDKKFKREDRGGDKKFKKHKSKADAAPSEGKKKRKRSRDEAEAPKVDAPKTGPAPKKAKADGGKTSSAPKAPKAAPVVPGMPSVAPAPAPVARKVPTQETSGIVAVKVARAPRAKNAFNPDAIASSGASAGIGLGGSSGWD